jgi:hypothetical protein
VELKGVVGVEFESVEDVVVCVVIELGDSEVNGMFDLDIEAVIGDVVVDEV